MVEHIIVGEEFPQFQHVDGGVVVRPSKHYTLPGIFMNAFEAEKALNRHDNLKRAMQESKKKKAKK